MPVAKKVIKTTKTNPVISQNSKSNSCHNFCGRHVPFFLLLLVISVIIGAKLGGTSPMIDIIGRELSVVFGVTLVVFLTTVVVTLYAKIKKLTCEKY